MKNRNKANDSKNIESFTYIEHLSLKTTACFTCVTQGR